MTVVPVGHGTLFTCERKQKLGIGTSRSSLPEERASHVVVKVGHNVTLLFFLFFLGVVLQCCINNLCCRFVVLVCSLLCGAPRSGQLDVFL